MKNRGLKFKIFLTNVSRVIRSFLFINVAWILGKVGKASAMEISCYDTVPIDELQVTCYAAVPLEEPTLIEKIVNFFESDLENVFIVFVPIVIIIATIIIVVKKRKKAKKENKNDKQN